MVQYLIKNVEIELDANEIGEAFSAEFAGWCPACQSMTIASEQVICDSCFEEAAKVRGMEVQDAR